MQFSEAYCGTTVSLAGTRGNGSFRAIILSLIYTQPTTTRSLYTNTYKKYIYEKKERKEKKTIHKTPCPT